MLISNEGEHLYITIDNLEWEDIFLLNDGEYVDVFTDDLNMEILFPNWKKYVNPQDVLDSLNYDDATRFKLLTISFDESIEGKDGQGTYNIVDYTLTPAIDDESDPMIVKMEDSMEQMMMITIYFEK